MDPRIRDTPCSFFKDANQFYILHLRKKQDNFDQYRLMRINESPKLVDVHFIEGDGSFVGGLGEPGVPIVQPALGNAIFAACGKRCRTLPFTPENINAS